MTTATTAFSSCSSTRNAPDAVLPWLCCRRASEPAWNEPTAALCHRTRPPPARRRLTTSLLHRTAHHALPSTTRPFVQSFFCAALLCLFVFSSGANAQQQVYGASDIFPGELLFDRRPPPLPNLPRMLLERRFDHGLPTTTTVEPTVSATATGSVQTATDTRPATLPKPFDTSIGNNFTSNACPQYFNSFLNNQTFQDCLPFSLLLQTSNSFFSISKSLLRLTQTLDVSCSVNFNECSTLMAGLAQEIQQDTTCGPDLTMQNPVVTQAFNGFIAYPTLYHAGCLTDMDGNYCFANAVTNASSPSSSYIYYLPLGVQLPGGARPACDQCLQDTMAIFAETATNSTQPLSRDYVGAAEQVQMNCGPTFVEASVTSSAAAHSRIPTPSGLAGLATMAVLLLSFL